MRQNRVCATLLSISNSSSLIIILQLFTYLIIKEMYSMIIEFQGKSLQKWYVVGHDLLIRKVKFVDNYRIHIVIRQQVVWKKKKYLHRFTEKNHCGNRVYLKYQLKSNDLMLEDHNFDPNSSSDAFES